MYIAVVVVEVYRRVTYVCHVHFNIIMMMCVVNQSMPITVLVIHI